jgi:hypothetical protein
MKRVNFVARNANENVAPISDFRSRDTVRGMGREGLLSMKLVRAKYQ